MFDNNKNVYILNTAFSLLTSFQSAIMILITTRICGEVMAGILSIAFADAYLAFTVGGYGVRNFHLSDVKRQYSYAAYVKCRTITCIFMLILGCGIIIVNDYDSVKNTIIIEMMMIKMIEVVEDVYHGELQRNGRLDVACSIGTVRLVVSYIAFTILLINTRKLEIALIAFLISSCAILMIGRVWFTQYLSTDKSVIDTSRFSFFKILKSCTSLFVVAFLGIYISNSPKYAIDACLSEQVQAYYAVISMPVFTINLLSGVMYRPQLVHLSELWNNSSIDGFVSKIIKQAKTIVIITVVIAILGATVGWKILGLIYGLELNDYVNSFVVLLIGGGFVAIVNYLTACITIIRKQKYIVVMSVVAASIALIFSGRLVSSFGIMGACVLFSLLTGLELLIAIYIVSVSIYQAKKSE